MPSSLRALLVLILFSSCGVFGKKDEVARIITPQGDGCYNQLASRIERFFNGKISEQEWVSTFDCVNDQIEFFIKFVRPSHERGYTEADIASLTRRFLITTKPVSDQFVRAILELKASSVGGDVRFVSVTELREFVRLGNLLKDETRRLLPLIRDQVQDPTSRNNIVLADALDLFGQVVAQHFSTLNGTVPFHKDTFIPFTRELLRLTGGDESVVDEYGDFVRHLKVVAAGGSDAEIESHSWSPLILDVTGIFGLYTAFADRGKIRFISDADKSEFYLQLVRRAEKQLQRLIVARGGEISLTEIDAVIDTVPTHDLNQEKRKALKAVLPNALKVALRSGTDKALNGLAVANAVSVYEEGMRGQVHVRHIFQNLPETVTIEQFEGAAEKYGSSRSAPERKEVEGLVEIAKTYDGLFPESGNTVRISDDTKEFRTKNHIEKMHWFNTVIRNVFQSYADGPDGSGQIQNLRVLVEHFDPILRAWRKAHPALTYGEVAEKRFMEANLFMPVSNGDKLMSVVEGTYYLAFLYSSGSLGGEIFRTIVGEGRCPITGLDDLKEPAIEADCFRREYFGDTKTFWANFPILVSHYSDASPARRALIAKSIESAARYGGYSEKKIGRYDIDSFAALPHYVESLMERFDKNNSDALSDYELMGLAYPVFRDTLRTFSGIEKEKRLRCSLAYIVKFGKVPHTLGEKLHFLAWCARPRRWNISADRGDLYRVVAMISGGKLGGSLAIGESDVDEWASLEEASPAVCAAR